ncbi:hypothetical protein ACWC4D_08295 [Streptomyces sp. NPDC001288]|uniref:hypothetical protein n=1 Tax=Streptomyces sp. NPDC001297 TaxID=3364559 RepID=UPI003687E0F9
MIPERGLSVRLAAVTLVTAALTVVTPAAHAAGTTLALDAQENYYLPAQGEGPNLDLGITASGGDAHDVSVVVDASSLAGKATMVVFLAARRSRPKGARWRAADLVPRCGARRPSSQHW